MIIQVTLIIDLTILKTIVIILVTLIIDLTILKTIVTSSSPVAVGKAISAS